MIDSAIAGVASHFAAVREALKCSVLSVHDKRPVGRSLGLVEV